MAEPEDAPELKRRFRAWVHRRFGIKGLVILAATWLAFVAWTQWDSIRAWPGVAQVLEWANREPVPKAHPRRFSVLVATLGGDADDAVGNLICIRLDQI
jgi:hypothetical protein